MTKHLLNRTQIGAIFQQVSGKGVAQSVGRDVLLNARLLLIVLDELPEALAAHPVAAHIDKEGRLIHRVHQLGPHIGYVFAQRPDGRGV